MKKSAKVFMIIAVIFLAVGLVICGITLPKMTWDFRGVVRRNHNGEKFETMPLEQHSLEGINRIEVVGDILDLKITPTSNHAMEAVYSYPDHLRYDYSITRQADVLVVKSEMRNGSWDNEASRLHLQLPQSYQKDLEIDFDVVDLRISDLSLKTLSIDLDAGNADLSRVWCETFSSTVTAGNLEMNQSVVGEWEAQCRTGHISYSGQAESANLDVNMGAITATFENGPSELHADCSTGEIDIRLPQSIPGFALDTSVSLGNFSCGFSTREDAAGMLIYGDGSARYDANVRIGSIRIESN